MTDEAFEVTGTRYVIVPRWVMELGLYEAAVYMAVASFMNEEHFGWPSHPKIAARACVSEKTVRRVLPVLEKSGAITKVKRFREDGGRSSNGYYIALDPPVPQTGGVVPQTGPPPVPGTDEVNPVLEGVEGEGSFSSMTLAAPASAGAREAERLCIELADAIEANGCKRPTITKTWLTEARLLVDKDLRHPDDVSKAIGWATSHAFWKANILSMPKLREKYDTLRLQAQRENEMGNGKSIGERRYDEAQDSLRTAMQRVEAGGAL